MDGGSPSACWHESMHALLTRVPIGVRVEDYSTVAFLSRSGYRREAQEHVYLELFAEKAAAWIGALVGFEREAVAAVELLDELKSRGRTINYEVEQFAWAKARAEWGIAWDKFGKTAIRLPATVKDEFERPTSTRFPSVEEVVGFYMAGDFRGPAGTKAAGKPIKVPKWVMWPGSAAMPVLMEDLDRKGPELKAGVWSAAFGVRFSEPRWRDHPRVTRGLVAVTLRSDDPTARIEVSYGGRSIPASAPAPGSSWRCFVVKLGGPAPASVSTGEEPIRVTVSAKDSIRSASAKEPVLPVHVLYRDDPPPASAGKAPGSIYLDTEGIFLVKLPTGAPSPSAPASSAQGGVPAAAGAGTVTVPRGGSWVLSERKIRKFGEEGLRYDMKTRLEVSDSGGAITVEYFDEATRRGAAGPPKIVGKLAFRFSWNTPPPLLVPGVPIPLEASASDAGSVDAPDTVIEVGHSVSGDVAAPGAAPKYPTMIKVRGVRQLAAAGTLTQTWTPPRGRASGWLSIACMVNQRDQGVALHFNYRWVEAPGSVPLPPGDRPSVSPPPAAAAPPVAAPPPQAGTESGSIEAQVLPPPPLAKALDETPPAPGELESGAGSGGGGGGTSAPEPTAGPARARWYVHPLGEYRIRLGRGWNQVTPSRIEGMDQLENGDGPWLLFPSRKRALTKKPSEEMEKLAKDWAAEGPASRRIPLRVAGEPALAVGKASRDGKTPIAFWHVVLSRKDRLCYLSAFAPASSGYDRLPTELQDLLSTLEFLSGSTAPEEAAGQRGPGRAESDALVKKAVELHDAKRYAEAIDALDRVLAVDPGFAEAWRRRGMAKRERKDLAGAVADFDESIRLEPAEPTAWAGRGLARERAGDTDGALADYGRAVELDPGYRKAWGYRATLRLRRNDFRGAASDFDVALRLDPPPDWAAWAHGARGLAREKLGDLAGARRDYREALALGSTDDGVRQSLKRIGEK